LVNAGLWMMPDALVDELGRVYGVRLLELLGEAASPNTVHLGMRKAYAVGWVFGDRQRWLVFLPASRLASV
jgi:hypothetical protein